MSHHRLDPIDCDRAGDEPAEHVVPERVVDRRRRRAAARAHRVEHRIVAGRSNVSAAVLHIRKPPRLQHGLGAARAAAAVAVGHDRGREVAAGKCDDLVDQRRVVLNLQGEVVPSERGPRLRDGASAHHTPLTGSRWAQGACPLAHSSAVRTSTSSGHGHGHGALAASKGRSAVVAESGR